MKCVHLTGYVRQEEAQHVTVVVLVLGTRWDLDDQSGLLSGRLTADI